MFTEIPSRDKENEAAREYIRFYTRAKKADDGRPVRPSFPL